MKTITEFIEGFKNGKYVVISYGLNILGIGYFLFLFLHNILSLGNNRLLDNVTKEKKDLVETIHENNEKDFKVLERNARSIEKSEKILSDNVSRFNGEWRSVAIAYSNRHPYKSAK